MHKTVSFQGREWDLFTFDGKGNRSNPLVALFSHFSNEKRLDDEIHLNYLEDTKINCIRSVNLYYFLIFLYLLLYLGKLAFDEHSSAGFFFKKSNNFCYRNMFHKLIINQIFMITPMGRKCILVIRLNSSIGVNST